jgi:hypothetical protein
VPPKSKTQRDADIKQLTLSIKSLQIRVSALELNAPKYKEEAKEKYADAWNTFLDGTGYQQLWGYRETRQGDRHWVHLEKVGITSGYVLVVTLNGCLPDRKAQTFVYISELETAARAYKEEYTAWTTEDAY